MAESGIRKLASAAEGAGHTLAAAGLRRSFALLAVGAACGLGLAGYGFFSAADGNALPAGAAARVNQGQILLTDFVVQTEALFDIAYERSTSAQRKEVLDAMITEELLVQRGLDSGVPATDAAVREALVAAVERQSSASIDAAAPAEAQLRAYFAAHPERYYSTGTMQLHDLSLALPSGPGAEVAMRTAQQAALELTRGDPVDAVKARHQLQANPALGQPDQIDAAVARQLAAPLYAAARQLRAGQASAALLSNGALHVLYCSARKASVARPYADVRAEVAAEFKRDARQRAQREYVKYLRDQATVVVNPRITAARTGR